MFTPNLPASNAAAIRADGYSARCHAHFFVPRIVAQGTVGAPTYPQAGQNPIILTLSYTTGAYTDVVYGMRITFTDASGNWKGESYVRTAEISAFVIQIPEYAQAKLNLDTGDIFTVWDEWRVHPLIVGARASFPPDLVEHTDEGSEPAPWINNGGLIAVKVDDGETFASIPFDLTGSFTVAPGSSGTINFTTHTQTGVAIAAGYTASDDQIVLEVDVGHYTIRFEGEDDTTGKVGYKYTPVIVYDDDHPPHDVLLTAYDGTLENGFNFSIEVLSGATDLATIPDVCLCILTADERYNEAWAAYRNAAAAREHVIGAGYIRRETRTRDGESGVNTVAFEVESPLSLLKQLTSYSKVMEENANPDAWSEVEILSVLRADKNLKQHYSNLPQVWDNFYDTDLYNPRYPAFFLQRSNFLDQSKELLDGIDAVMACDRTGRFNAYTFQPFVPLADRSGWDVHYLFIADEVLNLEFTRSHFDPVEQYKTSGFTGGTSGNTPLFSLYPGHAPGTGVDAPTRDRLIVVDQDDLNSRTGRYGALADDVYMDADGVKTRGGELRLTLRGGYNFLDFGKHYYAFDEALGNLDERLGDITGLLWYLTAVSWSAGEQGEGETTATFRVATNAAAGESYFPPDESLAYPPWEYPTPQPSPLPSLTLPGVLGRGTANLALFDSGANGYWLFRMSDGAVQFVDLTATGTPLQGTLLMFIQDAFSTANGVIVTTTHAYRIVAFNDETVVDLDDEYAFRYTSSYRSLQSERGDNGFFVCASHQDDGAVDIDRTLNSGATWTLSEQDLGSNWVGGSGDNAAPGCYVFAGASGKVAVSAFSTSTAGILKQSTDEGNSFSNVGSSSFIILAGDITAPLQNEAILYHGAPYSGGSYTGYRLGRTVGGVYTNVSPSYGGEDYGPVQQFSVKVCDSDQRKVLLVGQNRDQGTIKRGVFLSIDACATWRVLVTPDTTVTITGGTITSDGTIFLWGTATLWVSYNGGNSFLDKSAGLVAGGAGRIVNIAGV